MVRSPAVVVIGGGAAGMVAAIAAARAGAEVQLLERNPRVGRKLLATGNGRCNYANAKLDLARYHGAIPAFPAKTLGRFGLDKTLRFFSDLGIEPREEDGGKIFPRSGEASAVLDVLRHEMERLRVETVTGTRVTGIAPSRGAWTVRTRDHSRGAKAVILASGGRAAPQTGSDGSGYGLAAACGHRIVEPFPALTRIRVRSPWLSHLKGVKVEGTAAVVEGRLRLREAGGEILFTQHGLSGPPILDLSRAAGERCRAGVKVHLELDICPELGAGDLPGVLQRRFDGRIGAKAEFALVGFLHKRLIRPVLAEAGIDPGQPAGGIGGAGALSALLKHWAFAVTGTDPWSEAQVTAGGVDVRDVDPTTLESLLAPGLFFAGELLDVDGDCGGFNLQWAWSSGHLAGTSAAARALGARRGHR